MSQFLHYVVLFSAFAVLWFLSLFCLLLVGLGSERDPDSGAPRRAGIIACTLG